MIFIVAARFMRRYFWLGRPTVFSPFVLGSNVGDVMTIEKLTESIARTILVNKKMSRT